MIAYIEAPDIMERVKEIIFKLELDHVQIENIACFRSKGSAAEGTIARCHALSRIMQQGLKRPPFYAIEVLSEEFDKMDEEEQTKTLIHEVLHIPHAFGGGFKHHNVVNKRNVEKLYKLYKDNGKS